MAFPTTFEPKTGSASRYTLANLQSGQTVKVRVLSDFITGNSVWGEDESGKRKCTRTHEGERIPMSAVGTNKFTGRPERIKQFVAAVVWNYENQSLEILETDKSTIIEALFTYEMTEEYGDLKGYDVKIGRMGEKTDTTYSVVALPPKPATKDILEAYKAVTVDLEKLYSDENPFGDEQAAQDEIDSDQVASDVPF